jgi:OmpR family response regulator RpaB
MCLKVLIIDDDESLADLLTQYLARFDMQLMVANCPSKGYDLLQQHAPQAIILDVMLPEQDGFEVCKQIRKSSDIPIIMLTARGDVMDRVVGLEIGADDYLAKPFEPRELVARLQTILRRTLKKESIASTKESSLLEFNGLSINTQRQQVSLLDKTLELTTTEYRLLLLLAQSPQSVFSRDDILNHLKGVEVELFSRSVDIAISRLRQKLKEESATEFIKTVWGAGYCFVGESV